MNFASTLLVQLKDKLDKITDQSVRNDIETEIRKADLDLLDKINQLAQATGGGPFVPLLPNPLIAGEPSLGTLHFITAGNDAAEMLVAQAPGATVWQTVTFAGLQAGAKAVLVAVRIFSNVGALDYLRWRPTGSAFTWANSARRILVSTNVGGGNGVTSGAQVTVPIDSSGSVDLAYGVANSQFSVAYPQGYYI